MSLSDFLGREIANEEQIVDVVTALAQGYTRGQGFDGVTPRPDVAAVILSASARLAVNTPNAQAETYEVNGPDAFRHNGSPVMWSTAELSVLNRYRVRAQ
jgi:hypothetical protein